MTNQVLVFEIIWNNNNVDINGFKTQMEYEMFTELKDKLLYPFLDEELYKIDEFKASCIHRISVLRKIPESFKDDHDIFEPKSHIQDLAEYTRIPQKTLMIVIPSSIAERLQLNVGDCLVWESYQGEIIKLKIKRTPIC